MLPQPPEGADLTAHPLTSCGQIFVGSGDCGRWVIVPCLVRDRTIVAASQQGPDVQASRYTAHVFRKERDVMWVSDHVVKAHQNP
jgi:hypothetical protein